MCSGAARMPSSSLHLLASAAAGRFELVHLCVPLAGESAVGCFSVVLFARTVVEGSVGVDPDFDARVALKMDAGGSGGLGDSEFHHRSLDGAERGSMGRAGGGPQHGDHSD
jgi:hypothetical protein